MYSENEHTWEVSRSRFKSIENLALTVPSIVATYALGDFEAVLDAISSGRMKPDGMITKKIAMDKVAEEGFKALVEDKDNQVKILVDLTIPVNKE